MKIFISFLIPIVFITVTSFGQTTSNTVNPDWNADAHWTGTQPTYNLNQSATLAYNSDITNAVFVNSTYTLIIEAGVTLTTNESFTIKGDATVIVRGTLRGTNGGKEFKLEQNANLIVENGGIIDWAGYWTTNDNTVDITINGQVTVGGNFNNKGEITGTGGLTVNGSLNNDSGSGGTIFGCNGSGNTCCGGSSPCEIGNPLPVLLLYLQVSQINENVRLAWATSMEENFMKFVVQRSCDGLTFEEIGEVLGKGFNIYDIESKYSFEDEAPLLGYNYYRLKAIDLDDSFEYFGVKAVKVNGSKKMVVYPNPSSGELISFRTNFNPSESDRIILLNQLGVEIFNARASTAQNSISFKNKLHAGMYMLRYISKDFEQTARIIVKN